MGSVNVGAIIVQAIREWNPLGPEAYQRRATNKRARRIRKGKCVCESELADEYCPVHGTKKSFPTDEVTTMNIALLLPILGSVARTFLPAATAYLAGLGINVGTENPFVMLAIAGAVYVGAQVWSILRKVWRAKAGGTP